MVHGITPTLVSHSLPPASVQAMYMVERNESLPVLSGVKENSGTVRRYYIEAEEEVWDCECEPGSISMFEKLEVCVLVRNETCDTGLHGRLGGWDPPPLAGTQRASCQQGRGKGCASTIPHHRMPRAVPPPPADAPLGADFCSGAAVPWTPEQAVFTVPNSLSLGSK